MRHSVPIVASGKTNFVKQKPKAQKIFQCYISVVRVPAFGNNDMASQKVFTKPFLIIHEQTYEVNNTP